MDSEDKHEEDYYVDSTGKVVFTARFLKKRGYCCEHGCLNCPYEKPKTSRHGFGRWKKV